MSLRLVLAIIAGAIAVAVLLGFGKGHEVLLDSVALLIVAVGLVVP